MYFNDHSAINPAYRQEQTSGGGQIEDHAAGYRMPDRDSGEGFGHGEVMEMKRERRGLVHRSDCGYSYGEHTGLR